MSAPQPDGDRLFAAVRVYERKASLGGGWRGRYIRKGAPEAILTDRHDSPAAAWRDVRAILDRELRRERPGRPWLFGHYRGDRYRKNVFVY